VERREGVPGQHGKGRQAFSDYKVRLREKQKAKRTFGMLEAQFRDYYEVAAGAGAVTGTALLQRLEMRLDSLVYKLGFGASRNQSRQLVRHGHITVNGKLVTIPSYNTKVGDQVQVKEKSRTNLGIQSAMVAAQSRIIPEWLTLEKDLVKGAIKSLPTREQLPQSINDQLIVELYSR